MAKLELKKGIVIEQGSLSEGTMRVEDLVPCFMDFLQCFLTGASFKYIADQLDEVNDSDDEYAMDYFLNETLWDAMNEIAPDNCYFGAQPGDGSDYGFWECEDEDFEDYEEVA